MQNDIVNTRLKLEWSELSIKLFCQKIKDRTDILDLMVATLSTVNYTYDWIIQYAVMYNNQRLFGLLCQTDIYTKENDQYWINLLRIAIKGQSLDIIRHSRFSKLDKGSVIYYEPKLLDYASSTLKTEFISFVYDNGYCDSKYITSNVSFYCLLQTLDLEFIQKYLSNGVYNYSLIAFTDFILHMLQMSPELMTYNYLDVFCYIQNQFEEKMEKTKIDYNCEVIDRFGKNDDLQPYHICYMSLVLMLLDLNYQTKSISMQQAVEKMISFSKPSIIEFVLNEKKLNTKGDLSLYLFKYMVLHCPFEIVDRFKHVSTGYDGFLGIYQQGTLNTLKLIRTEIGGEIYPSVVHREIERSNIETVRYLMEECNIKKNSEFLEKSFRCGNLEIALYLLTKGEQTFPNYSKHKHFIAEHYIVLHKESPRIFRPSQYILETMVYCGMDEQLTYALRQINTDSLESENIHKLEKYSPTVSFLSGNLDLVKLLLDNGVVTNLFDYRCWSVAAKLRSFELLDFLKTHSQNNLGKKYSIQTAHILGYNDIVEYLKKL